MKFAALASAGRGVCREGSQGLTRCDQDATARNSTINTKLTHSQVLCAVA
jgi:hypothetical protein